MAIEELAKPLEKLVETMSIGVGVLGNHIFEFDVKKIQRIGNAEAEVEKQKIVKKAEGFAEAQETMFKAGNRFKLEQYTKQVNIENVVAGAKENLEGKVVSDIPVDKDWSFKFLQIAQDISREDVQKILSKILSEEVISPNSFNLRTLDFIKNLSKKDLIIFKKILPYIDTKGNMHLTNQSANEGAYNITYAELMYIIEIGLLQPTLTTSLNLRNVKKEDVYPIFLGNEDPVLFKVVIDSDIISLPVLQLTSIGLELSKVIELEQIELVDRTKYVEELTPFMLSKSLEKV